MTGARVNPDGTKETTRRTEYERIGVSTGFSGAWRVLGGAKPETKLMITSLTEKGFHIAFPLETQYTDMTLDGVYAKVHGKVPTGATMALTPDGPLRFKVSRKLDGIEIAQGVLMLRPDGQLLVYEWWKPERPDLKGREVYSRQP